MTLKKIRRDQLAKFIPDQEVIIRFQQLFQAAGEDNPSLIESGGIDAVSALSAANEIKGVLNSFIADSGNNIAALEAKINELSCALYLLKESRDKEPPPADLSNSNDIDIKTVNDYLSLLNDVYIPTISDNDLIAWDASNNRFADTSDPIVDTITVNTEAYLNGDNVKLYAGAGNDISYYYDGTDGNLKTDETAPSDLNITCGANKTVELQNVVYDDLQGGISNIFIPPANAPTYRFYDHGIGGGVTFPVLGFAVNDHLYFDVQTSHRMKLNTVLDNHIHFMTPTDGSATPDRFQFQLDVITAPIGGNWTAPTGTPFTAEHIITADYTNSHEFFDIASIPASNSSLSTIYKCELTRIAASQDEYGGEVYVEFIDCHYQVNTMGSRQENSK